MKLIFDPRPFPATKKPLEELGIIGPKIHEATDVEANEEFTLLADTFAPPFIQRAPEGTAPLGKRKHLTAADKRKVDKASIGLPVDRTLKLFTYNCNPFILEFTIPLEEFRKKSLGQPVNIPSHPGLNTISGPTPAHVHSTSGVQQRISLGGTTLCSIVDQGPILAPQDLVPGPAEDSQNRQTSNEAALPVISNSYQTNVNLKLLAKVLTWLKDVIDEEEWVLIERSARQRKSRVRQMPKNTMLTETNGASNRGSSNTRTSGSFLHPGESHTRTIVNLTKDHPCASVRRPKHMPSGSQLPSCWNDEMDQFICHMDAQGDFSTKSIVRALKQRFADLRDVSGPVFSLPSWCSMLTLYQSIIQEDAIQRRIDTLDNQDNTYFVKGAEMAVVQAEANGYDMPAFDPGNYPIINWVL